jgi:hypothetical protein
MPDPPNSKLIEQLLKYPNVALVRRFRVLGYSMLLRLQSDLTASERQVGDAVVAHIALQKKRETTTLSPEQEDLVKEALDKMVSYCKTSISLINIIFLIASLMLYIYIYIY